MSKDFVYNLENEKGIFFENILEDKIEYKEQFLRMDQYGNFVVLTKEELKELNNG